MRIFTLLCFAALLGCSVHTEPMFDDLSDSGLHADADSGLFPVPDKDSAPAEDSGPDSGSPDSADAEDAQIAVDAGTDSGVVADVGSDAPTSSIDFGQQCDPCRYNDDCGDADSGWVCSGHPGRMGVCLAPCTVSNPGFCTVENGLNCQTVNDPDYSCLVNLNVFPDGCTEWRASQ